jgi:hypothetical protein
MTRLLLLAFLFALPPALNGQDRLTSDDQARAINFVIAHMREMPELDFPDQFLLTPAFNISMVSAAARGSEAARTEALASRLDGSLGVTDRAAPRCTPEGPPPRAICRWDEGIEVIMASAEVRGGSDVLVRIHRHGPDGFIGAVLDDGSQRVGVETAHAIVREGPAGWSMVRFERISRTPGLGPGGR